MHPALRRIGFTILLAFFAAAVLASPATAIIDVRIATVDSSSPLDALTVGDTIDLGIVVEADPDRGGVVALGLQAYGFDQSVARAVGVDAVPEFFSASVLSTPAGPIGIGGIANLAASTPSPPSADLIRMVYGVTITPAPGVTGRDDIGVGGRLISEGDVHARIRLEIVGAGTTTISFGAVRQNFEIAAYNDGSIADSEVATFTFTAAGVPTQAIPEPSAALLFGAGLCAAWIGRRG